MNDKIKDYELIIWKAGGRIINGVVHYRPDLYNVRPVIYYRSEFRPIFKDDYKEVHEAINYLVDNCGYMWLDDD